MEKFDYIIIGAGSSGCALAKGLTENATNTVLLLEAGPHADRFWVNTPAGMAKLFFSRCIELELLYRAYGEAKRPQDVLASR
ncbi:hypothetical protein C086_01530 [Brucella abortus F6/05-3]|uniref:lycopene cyclase family protein n=1 Tax=Brucella melitensis TaxID=29459 RepID=UPI0002CDD4A2|nr:lycopene cyclase family protein [Brucella abortus]ARY44697.1 hypothetical protein BK153_08440 [Brucella melitensis]ENQ70280.1 hypothetical protein C962_00204 [Brucella melitensis CNGB 1076]ENQ73561.1 hypothetical protein C963_00005 [Brucella melitensis CNGB 1120]ENQ76132.1 hypothetical protein C964_00635 [Brucella melitensis CNGB 290]ENQ79760.1 hypothetical protein C057_00430 [Brucella melitensis F10/05-2]ENQ85685.1 hypothetical protein C056_00537 [Brucella melitensis F3/02]ENQ97617.1 hyp